MDGAQSINPILRYGDPVTAAAWLCQAFGFRQDAVTLGPNDEISHILLRMGKISVLVCPAAANRLLDDFMVQPEHIGGANTQICYLSVRDIDAQFARAQASGARIEVEPQDDGTGGRGFICRDIEGHIWSIGTHVHGSGRTSGPVRGRLGRRLAVAAVILLVGGWGLYEVDVQWLRQKIAAHGALTGEVARRTDIEAVARKTAAQLEREQALRTESQEALRRVRGELSAAREAKVAADRAAAQATEAKNAAEQSATSAIAALAKQEAQAKADHERLTAIRRDSDLIAARFQAEQAARTGSEQQVEAIRTELENERQANLAARRRFDQATAAAQARERASSEAAGERLAELQQLNQQIEAEVRAQQALRLRSEQQVASLKEEIDSQRQSSLSMQSELEEAKARLAASRETGRREENIALSRVPVMLQSPSDGAKAQRLEDDAGNAKGNGGAEGRLAIQTKSTCALAVQGKIPSRHKGPSMWDAATLNRLCKGAEISVEPARCFEQLMSGGVKWGSGGVWLTSNAVALCAGTRSASKTISCFVSDIAGGRNWRNSIAKCRAR